MRVGVINLKVIYIQVLVGVLGFLFREIVQIQKKKGEGSLRLSIKEFYFQEGEKEDVFEE